AISNIHETKEVIDRAISINQMGLQKIDSLHLACAILTKCEYFLTTDDKILKKQIEIEFIYILDPIAFVKEILP
ncbi:MAG: PIN domain protein, partial [Candidatus Omnitrophota bacterium]